MSTEPTPTSHKNPWWNDGNRVASLITTLIFMGVAVIFLALCIKIAIVILA